MFQSNFEFAIDSSMRLLIFRIVKLLFSTQQ